MTDEQYRALLDAVIEAKEASNGVKRELTGIRAEMAQLTGAVHALRGEVILIGAKVEVVEDDVSSMNSKLVAMMQTIDGMNHLAKSAYDMAVDNVEKLKSVDPKLKLEFADGKRESR